MKNANTSKKDTMTGLIFQNRRGKKGQAGGEEGKPKACEGSDCTPGTLFIDASERPPCTVYRERVKNGTTEKTEEEEKTHVLEKKVQTKTPQVKEWDQGKTLNRPWRKELLGREQKRAEGGGRGKHGRRPGLPKRWGKETTPKTQDRPRVMTRYLSARKKGERREETIPGRGDTFERTLCN